MLKALSKTKYLNIVESFLKNVSLNKMTKEYYGFICVRMSQ